ncbi:MAG TPA: hypothetical protein VFB13_11950 [Reyranella sp.]|jgi:hypothetical protein|nr:hypothetical protein [Reyranella sp.]
MTKSLLFAACATLVASAAFAQSPAVTRSGAPGSTAGNNVESVFTTPRASTTPAKPGDDGNPAVDRSGASGSTAANNVGAVLASKPTTQAAAPKPGADGNPAVDRSGASGSTAANNVSAVVNSMPSGSVAHSPSAQPTNHQ